MSDVLLIYPPYLSKHKNPPLGLAYLASLLEKNGYHSKILDMNPMGMPLVDLGKVIRESHPMVVGISFMTNQYGNALKAAQISKEELPDVPVVVGGNHVSALPNEIMSNDFVDFAVLREGEETFLNWVDMFSKGLSNWREIDGLVYKENGEIIRNKDRAFLHDLDLLPFPKWDDFPIDAYSERILGATNELPVFSILSSRGCPANCTFCSSHTIWERLFRKRSAENIFSELEYLEKKFDALHFNFLDDTLTIDKKRIHLLCDLIIESQKKYRWIANARVNTVDFVLLQKMYRAGCRNICYGVESGDPEVRKRIGKGIDIRQIKNAHRWAKDAGLIVSSFFMVGNPGETWNGVEKTIALARELQTEHPSCSIATPFPGTEFMAEAESKGWLISRDWDKYITNPHIDQNFTPVSTNGVFTAEEMLAAYYKVNAAFIKVKLTTKYGKWYFLNPQFFIKELWSRFTRQGVRDSLRLGMKLFREVIRS